MKTLYETILTSTNSGLQATIWNKTKPVIDSVLNSSSEFQVEWFLEGNNIRLDKDTTKKIVNKLKKVLPEGALFGYRYGIPQIAKQNIEGYGVIKHTNPRFAYYRIEIEYAYIWHEFFKSGVSTKIFVENLICLTGDYIYALDIPETKSILNNLDKHFSKYVIQDEVKLTDTYTMQSKIGGKYRVYSFKDIIKEFIDGK